MIVIPYNDVYLNKNKAIKYLYFAQPNQYLLKNI